MAAERLRRVACLVGLCLVAACATTQGSVDPQLAAAAERSDALAVSDALETLIAERRDTPADREYAYQVVIVETEDTAASTFGRAAVTGRLVQQRGLLGASLVGDVERWALRSRELEPDFRDGAATRLLGTLYVVAPSSLLAHGDSEAGVALLEGLVRDHPESLENHLRLAEAYIALGDPAPAASHLCTCLEGRASLRPDDEQLLDQLVVTADQPPCSEKR